MPNVPALNIQYPDVGRSMLAGQQLQNMQQQNALNQMNINKQTGMQNALSGVQSLEDIPNAIPGIMKADPVQGINLLSQVGTIKRQQEEEARKLKKEAMEFSIRATAPLLDMDDQTASKMWPRVAQTIKQNYPMFADQVPQQWDRNLATQVVGMGISPDKRFELQNKIPTTRSYQVGDEQVTEEVLPGGRTRELGRGNKFKPTTDSTKDTDISLFNKGIDDRWMNEKGRLPTPAERLDEWNKNKVSLTSDKARATAEGKSQSVDQNAVKWAVSQVKAGNPVPLGRGQDFMKAVYSDLQRDVEQSGQNPESIAAATNIRKSLASSLQNQEKVLGMMGGFVRNLDKQIDRTNEVSKDLVSRVGVRALDIPIREWKTRFAGSGNEKILEAYLLEISNEIGKLSTGSSASIAELSVAAQDRWTKIHDPALSIRELQTILNETKDMGHMRLQSAKEERDATTQSLTKVGSRLDKSQPIKEEPSISLPPMSAFSGKQDGEPARFKNGQVWALEGGKPVRHPELEGQ